jgi:hypothetical protein
MATIQHVGEVATAQLRERVDRLFSAIEEDSSDLAEVSRLADAVGELADRISEIYTEIAQTLVVPQPGQGQGQASRGSGQNDSADEELTKEELLERAREVNVPGRSSMSKEELAEAVEAEESLTKEELLERARDAGIEGRSAMSKDELRKALREANA